MEKEFGLAPENEQRLSGSGKAVQIAERAKIKWNPNEWRYLICLGHLKESN